MINYFLIALTSFLKLTNRPVGWNLGGQVRAPLTDRIGHTKLAADTGFSLKVCSKFPQAAAAQLIDLW